MTKKSLLATAETLIDLLARENQALKTMNLPQAASLVAAKQAALADLKLADLNESAGTMAPAALAGLGQRLHALATENQGLLEQAITVQSRVIQIVAGAYKPPTDTMRYGPTGAPAASRAPAVALSTRC